MGLSDGIPEEFIIGVRTSLTSAGIVLASLANARMLNVHLYQYPTIRMPARPIHPHPSPTPSMMIPTLIIRHSSPRQPFNHPRAQDQPSLPALPDLLVVPLPHHRLIVLRARPHKVHRVKILAQTVQIMACLGQTEAHDLKRSMWIANEMSAQFDDPIDQIQQTMSVERNGHVIGIRDIEWAADVVQVMIDAAICGVV